MQELIGNKLKELYPELTENFIQIQKTRAEFEGDMTLVVFPLLRVTKKNPVESGNFIGEFLQKEIPMITGFNVVKGFLNLEIDSQYWLEQFNSILETKSYGQHTATDKAYIVEYSSPNTNKPLHLGHLRNNFLGYSVAEILKANGHEVVKTQIINDRGIHICKSMLAWEKLGNGETPNSSGLKGDKLVGKYYVAFDKQYKEEIAELLEAGKTKEEAEKQAPILIEAQEMLMKWEKNDPETIELWKTMNGWVYEGFAVTYNTMGVDFDKLYYESDTYILGKDIVEEGLQKKVLYKKEDGSVWCDLSDEKMDDKLLLRGDGTSVYMTQDVGTAVERFKDYPKTTGMIYTVGNEQDHHFKVLFVILKKLGYSFANECSHLSYGMVNLPTGRMKSREGTVVDADELMQDVVDDAKAIAEERGHLEGMSEEQRNSLYKTIGMGGLKYYLLKVDPRKSMMFNPEESIDLNGNTGPFIQYTYARTQSILRKQSAKGTIEIETELEKSELDIIKHLVGLPEMITEAGKNQSPALVSNYTYELVKLYNSFYQSVSIFKEEDEKKQNLRLLLTQQVSETVEFTMSLLGISVPEKM
ncbi:MAG: arginyl-tRNA synthetase [Flavobacteriales bacterium]|jgi:arginyl-tRNA synthetase|tara:strand:+ start:577 stop:2331 length:1755 start_codon:yes stop_codon:yes gene_type:complete